MTLRGDLHNIMNNDDNKIISYFDTLKGAQITIVRREIDNIVSDALESISFCFKNNPFQFSEIVNLGDGLFPSHLKPSIAPETSDINSIGVFEYYDSRRLATISFLFNADLETKPVIALQIHFDERYPVSLSSIFSVEKKTFIGMPRGFVGVPVSEFEDRQQVLAVGANNHSPLKKGCSDCGK
ncbi:hypothetical protein [Candidatus Magnetomonas plexicatena]|uniref:hypothetical protein n=1 Tax=Candidatus Magnetomonas plexicatena TaxID=2552947 RepID=UPI001C78C469|nr:hypothetical protein E2O03_000405 [Nitrospirales bacterium LBB_01]